LLAGLKIKNHTDEKSANIFPPFLYPSPTPPQRGAINFVFKIRINFLNSDMIYLGRTVERTMYYGASDKIRLRAKSLRKKMTKAEKLLWSRLKNKQLGEIFHRQHPIDIFIVDFYYHEHKLVIEVDGEIHKKPDVKERDEGRTFEMGKYGTDVLRFTNKEIFANPKEVIEIIKEKLREK